MKVNNNDSARASLELNRRRWLGRAIALAAGASAAGSLVGCGGGDDVDPPADPTLRYSADISQPFPIPPSERSLATVVAEPYYQVSASGIQLEGAAFDRQGNLLFVEVGSGRVFKLSPNKSLTTLFAANSYGSAGIAIHKDGRIFVAGLGNLVDTGRIYVINPDGSGFANVIAPSAGFVPDDLVFDAAGGFYFTDFRGDTNNPIGAVYYVSPDFKTITPIIRNMAIANGVCLSPDGKVLWATEFYTGKLHRVELSAPTKIADFGTAVPYHFNGYAPDSMRSDSDGNVYVAMYSQGRVLAFNRNGIAIGQILLPKRETGHNMVSTSLGFVPGTNEMLILTNDGTGGDGAWIFHANGFAKGTPLYSHQ
jgi:lactonase